MADTNSGGSENPNRDPVPEKMDFDIDADIRHLKSSSRYLAIALVVLAVAFFLIFILNMSGYFEIQQTVGAFTLRNKVYALENEVPVFKDPTEASDKVGTLTKGDHAFELQRTAGFYQIQSTKFPGPGWVSQKLMTEKVNIAAASKGIDKNMPLELIVNLTQSQKDIQIQGKVVNLLDVPVINIRLLIAFFSEDMQPIQSEMTNLAPKGGLNRGTSAPFSVTRAYMAEKARFVTCEIEDFDVAPATILIKGSEKGGEDTEIPPAPAPTPAP